MRLDIAFFQEESSRTLFIPRAAYIKTTPTSAAPSSQAAKIVALRRGSGCYSQRTAPSLLWGHSLVLLLLLLQCEHHSLSLSLRGSWPGAVNVDRKFSPRLGLAAPFFFEALHKAEPRFLTGWSF